MSDSYAVLDTCVLLPSPIYNTLLYMADIKLFNPIWTNRIIDELRRHLNEWQGEELAEKRISKMQQVFPEANLDSLGIDYVQLIDEMPNHPKDRHVLAAAVAIEAEYLITYNLKDFRLGGTDYAESIKVMTPDAFLTELFDASELNQVNMLAALYLQVSHMRSVRTPDDLLSLLKKDSGCTNFVARINKFTESFLNYPPYITKPVCEGQFITLELWSIHQHYLGGQK